MSQQQFHLELNINHSAYTVTFDYRRAVYLAGMKTLLASDLHWGKSRVFQKHGIPVTEEVMAGDLKRLSALLKHYNPKRLLVLGDLIHGASGLTAGLIEMVLRWRSENPVDIVLVEGNHDRAIQKVSKQWDLQLSDDFCEGLFFFSHYPKEMPGLFNWCGHIHPKVLLASRTDTLRLPCFHMKRGQGTLPGFSFFTGGYNIEPAVGEKVIAIADEGLFAI